MGNMTMARAMGARGKQARDQKGQDKIYDIPFHGMLLTLKVLKFKVLK